MGVEWTLVDTIMLHSQLYGDAIGNSLSRGGRVLEMFYISDFLRTRAIWYFGKEVHRYMKWKMLLDIVQKTLVEERG